MTQMKMKIHSMSYPAMNSSGTVYFNSNDDFRERGFEALNAILKVVGCEGRAEDFFEIGSIPDPDIMLDRFYGDIEKIDVNDIDDENARNVVGQLIEKRKIMEGMSWPGSLDFFKKEIWPFLNDPSVSEFFTTKSCECSDEITITAKGDPEAEIFGIFRSMFSLESGYDG